MRTYIMNLTFKEGVIRTYWEKCTQGMYTMKLPHLYIYVLGMAIHDGEKMRNMNFF